MFETAILLIAMAQSRGNKIMGQFFQFVYFNMLFSAAFPFAQLAAKTTPSYTLKAYMMFLSLAARAVCKPTTNQAQNMKSNPKLDFLDLLDRSNLAKVPRRAGYLNLL